ncbi:MAG: glycosyltransferase [Anaerolineaceae bacterium]|nr:glycosyltransferase [Anaerolineaceae bacterium]
MRLLIWCPHVNLGGGKRLLSRLTAAIAAHPNISHVRLAMPAAAADDLHFNTDKVEIMRLNPAQSGGWMAKESWRAESNPFRSVRSRARYLRYQTTAPGLFHSLEQDVDAVYVFWPHIVPFFPFQKPIICTFQDVTLLDYPEILGGRVTALEHERSRDWLTKSSAVIVSSNHTTQRLKTHFQLPFDNVHRVYHNILLDGQLPTENASTLKGLPSKYFLYPANINAHKNHENLLLAWARFERRQDYPLVLVGEGVDVMGANHPLSANHYWRQDVLQGLMKRLGLVAGRDVYTFGYVSDADLNQIQGRAGAVIMPSLSEGGGSYPVEEALALGIPVVCSDIPVMRETLTGRDAAVRWFDAYSPDEIVKSVDSLLGNYDHYKQAAEIESKKPRPTWSDVADQYVQVFETAVNKPRQSP